MTVIIYRILNISFYSVTSISVFFNLLSLLKYTLVDLLTRLCLCAIYLWQEMDQFQWTKWCQAAGAFCAQMFEDSQHVYKLQMLYNPISVLLKSFQRLHTECIQNTC